jgi:hypothetical protein
LDKLHVVKNAAERIDDIVWIKISRRVRPVQWPARRFQSYNQRWTLALYLAYSSPKRASR